MLSFNSPELKSDAKSPNLSIQEITAKKRAGLKKIFTCNKKDACGLDRKGLKKKLAKASKYSDVLITGAYASKYIKIDKANPLDTTGNVLVSSPLVVSSASIPAAAVDAVDLALVESKKVCSIWENTRSMAQVEKILHSRIEKNLDLEDEYKLVLDLKKTEKSKLADSLFNFFTKLINFSGKVINSIPIPDAWGIKSVANVFVYVLSFLFYKAPCYVINYFRSRAFREHNEVNSNLDRLDNLGIKPDIANRNDELEGIANIERTIAKERLLERGSFLKLFSIENSPERLNEKKIQNAELIIRLIQSLKPAINIKSLDNIPDSEIEAVYENELKRRRICLYVKACGCSTNIIENISKRHDKYIRQLEKLNQLEEKINAKESRNKELEEYIKKERAHVEARYKGYIDKKVEKLSKVKRKEAKEAKELKESKLEKNMNLLSRASDFFTNLGYALRFIKRDRDNPLSLEGEPLVESNLALMIPSAISTLVSTLSTYLRSIRIYKNYRNVARMRDIKNNENIPEKERKLAENLKTLNKSNLKESIFLSLTSLLNTLGKAIGCIPIPKLWGLRAVVSLSVWIIEEVFYKLPCYIIDFLRSRALKRATLELDNMNIDHDIVDAGYDFEGIANIERVIAVADFSRGLFRAEDSPERFNKRKIKDAEFILELIENLESHDDKALERINHYVEACGCSTEIVNEYTNRYNKYYNIINRYNNVDDKNIEKDISDDFHDYIAENKEDVIESFKKYKNKVIEKISGVKIKDTSKQTSEDVVDYRLSEDFYDEEFDNPEEHDEN